MFILVQLVLVGCTRDLAGGSWPGVSAENSRVFVAYGPEVVAVDVDERSQAWRFSDENLSAQYYSPPYFQDGQVIVADMGSSSGFLSPGVSANVYALDDDSGSVAGVNWSAEGVAEDRIIAQPLQADGKVFIGTADNMVIALDADSGLQGGEPIWTVEVGHSVWGQPTLVDGILLIASLDHFVYALDAENGAELWKFETLGGAPSKPIVDGGRVYISGFDSSVHALDVTSGDEIWSYEATDWIWQSPFLSNGRIFGADVKGNVFALDADSGELLWQNQMEGQVEAAVIEHNGVVVVPVVIGEARLGQTGQIVGLSAESGDQEWRNETTYPIFVNPIVADDSLIITYQDENAPFSLAQFDFADGNQLWSFTPTE